MPNRKNNSVNKNQLFYIHDEHGSNMGKIRGYDKALKAIKLKPYVAQLNYLDKDKNKFIMVYAHVPKGKKVELSQMLSAMKRQNIKPNVEYKNKLGESIVNKSKHLKEQRLSKLQLAYREFFKSKMDEFGIKSPVDLKTDKSRKDFWNSIKNEWPIVKNNIQEGILRQVIRGYIAEFMNSFMNKDK